jgi:hypothetical protein
MIELRKEELTNKLVGITEQGQNGLAKDIIFLIILSFGGKLRCFFILQLVLQPLQFLLQRISILAGFGGYFNCAFKLRRRRLDLLLQSSFINFERSKLGGKDLQGRNNCSKILGV